MREFVLCGRCEFDVAYAERLADNMYVSEEPMSSKDKPAPTLGATLKASREAQGLSLRQLAALVGGSPSMALRWERGDDVPEPKYLVALARTLDLRSADLFLLAGVPLPYDGPTLPAMLRAEYDLPPEAIAEIQRSIERVARKYGAKHREVNDKQ
jgi:putative transcriptional regulator